MRSPESYRKQILQFRRREYRAALLLTLTSLFALLVGIGCYFFPGGLLGLGLAASIASTALAGFVLGIRDLRRIRIIRREDKSDLLELNPQLVCRQECIRIEPMVRFLRKRRQIELMLSVSGLLFFLLSSLAFPNRLLAGIGCGLAAMGFLLMIFSLTHLWRAELFLQEMEETTP